jgi:hypothetical protein
MQFNSNSNSKLLWGQKLYTNTLPNAEGAISMALCPSGEFTKCLKNIPLLLKLKTKMNNFLVPSVQKKNEYCDV